MFFYKFFKGTRILHYFPISKPFYLAIPVIFDKDLVNEPRRETKVLQDSILELYSSSAMGNEEKQAGTLNCGVSEVRSEQSEQIKLTVWRMIYFRTCLRISLSSRRVMFI